MKCLKFAYVAILFMVSGRYVCAQVPPGTVLWTFDLNTSVISSPALATDGTIYVGTSVGLCAITNNSTSASNKWVFGSTSFPGSPAIANDGTIYCGGADGEIYAINPADGSQKWSSRTQGEATSPAVSADDAVYVGGYGYVFALHPSGVLRWKSPSVLPYNTYKSPALAVDGTIYVSADRAKFYAFDPDGNQKWVQSVPTGAAESPAIGVDATVYAVANSLVAFTAGGSNTWSFGSFDGSPVIGYEGTIYLRGFSDHRLYAISRGGQLIWQTAADGFTHSPPTSPAIDSAGTLYYCTSNSLVAVTPQGQMSAIVYAGGDPSGPPLANTSPLIGPDGTIYFALGTKVYAIAGTNGLAQTPWPMFRQNPRHTGKVEKPALKPPKKRADANFEFQLYAQLGQTNVIETTTNLSTWTALTNVVITNVPMDVVDLSASNHPFRFYRSLVP